MSTIYIESRSVNYPLLDLFHHEYLVYKDASGNEYDLAGYPTNNIPIGYPLGNPLLPWGYIETYPGGPLQYSPDARGTDNPVTDRGQVSLDIGTRDAADVWNVMTQVANQISSADIAYDPLGTNSNTAVDTMLQAVGLAENHHYPYPTNASAYSVIGEGILNFSRNLVGTSGSDIIQGWHQNDTLSGGTGGTDFLKGNDGVDTYNIQVFNGSTLITPHDVKIDDLNAYAQMTFDGFGSVPQFFEDHPTGWPISVDYTIGHPDTGNGIEWFGIKFNSAAHEIDIYDLSHSDSLIGRILNVQSVGSNWVTAQGGITYNRSTNLNGDQATGQDHGGQGADTITGSGSGAFSVFGEAGNDILSTGSGNDFLDGGAGNDAMSGGAGNDIYVIDSSGDSITESASSGIDTVYSSISYTLGSNLENLILTASLAVATGNSLNNEMGSQGQADTLVGGGGADTLHGDGFFTAASYSTASAAVSINLATNVNTGSDAAGDVLYHIQEVIGSAYNDTLVGSGADETFIGGAGSDSIDGGGGIDTLSYATSTSAISGNLGTNNFFNGDAAYDTVQHVENLIGSAYNDYLGGDSGTNVLDGGTGNDSIEGFDGNDTLYGGAGDDLLFGGNGDDLIYGGPGSDYIDGGAGNDTLSFANSTAYISANLSTNSFFNGEASWDNVMANVENLIGSAYGDYLGGSSVANLLNGGDGNDSIEGFDSNDTLIGGNGDDQLYGGNGNDLIIAGPGSDYVDGGAGNDTLSFETSTTWVSADLAANSYWNGDAAWDNVTAVENLTGSAYNDYLYGNTAANILSGGDGDDRIEGRGGSDTLIGGNGIDTFAFTTGGTGTDTISDFQGAGVAGGDVIQIASGIYSTAATALTHVTYSGGNADLDLGSGHIVHLVGVTSLVAGDLAIV